MGDTIYEVLPGAYIWLTDHDGVADHGVVTGVTMDPETGAVSAVAYRSHKSAPGDNLVISLPQGPGCDVIVRPRVQGARRSEAVPAPAPEEDDRTERLLQAEERKIRELGEAGYESPFYMGPPGIADPGARSEDVRDYWRWRRARTEYVARPTPENYAEMLKFVTLDCPPLDGDVRPLMTGSPVPRHSRGWTTAMMIMIVAIALMFSALMMGV